MNFKPSVVQENLREVCGILCQGTDNDEVYFSQTAVVEFKSRVVSIVQDITANIRLNIGMYLESLRQAQASMYPDHVSNVDSGINPKQAAENQRKPGRRCSFSNHIFRE